MKKKIIRCGTFLLFSGLVVGGGVIYYLFNMSHKDVQAAALDFHFEARELVNEYLASAQMVNNKYALEERDFKIATAKGTIASNDMEMKQQDLVFLKEAAKQKSIECTFLENINVRVQHLKIGEMKLPGDLFVRLIEQ